MNVLLNTLPKSAHLSVSSVSGGAAEPATNVSYVLGLERPSSSSNSYIKLVASRRTQNDDEAGDHTPRSECGDHH